MNTQEMLALLHESVRTCPAINPETKAECDLEIGHAQEAVVFQDKAHAWIDNNGDMHHWFG